MYLVDTNVWLERLLDQEKSKEVGIFLDTISSKLLYMTDFTFHSIGLIMVGLRRSDDFLQKYFDRTDLARKTPEEAILK